MFAEHWTLNEHWTIVHCFTRTLNIVQCFLKIRTEHWTIVQCLFNVRREHWTVQCSTLGEHWTIVQCLFNDFPCSMFEILNNCSMFGPNIEECSIIVQCFEHWTPKSRHWTMFNVRGEHWTIVQCSFNICLEHWTIVQCSLRTLNIVQCLFNVWLEHWTIIEHCSMFEANIERTLNNPIFGETRPCRFCQSHTVRWTGKLQNHFPLIAPCWSPV